MNVKLISVLPLLLLSLANTSQAAVSLDRTRVIFPGETKSISLNVRNNNKTLPYLAQAWLEDVDGKNITGPFTVLPPLQRLEPGMESLFKIQALAAVNKLPKDQESLFYFNMREIPPRSDKPNTLQLALQTRIKFFYRPASLLVEPGANKSPWQHQVVVKQKSGKTFLENPTPYYITIVDAYSAGKSVDEFEPVMLSPYGNVTLAQPLGKQPSFTYIDDYGGRQQLDYTCTSHCILNKGDKK